jgi:hypothetical protein
MSRVNIPTFITDPLVYGNCSILQTAFFFIKGSLDITLYSPLEVSRRFERTHYIHLQDRSQARNYHEAGSK